ncbi:hypothetical protein [Streptomyces murinus]|uniref:hypothetical protein n=1 Tax=Streptomyces murinus TaxID=33900 RepID=UPI00380CE542
MPSGNGYGPVRVLRLGSAYRVPTAELLKLLGLERQQADGGDGGVPDARAEGRTLAA